MLQRRCDRVHVSRLHNDTLNAIAEKFGVPIEEIVKANNLTNPDVLSIGQELIISGR